MKKALITFGAVGLLVSGAYTSTNAYAAEGVNVITENQEQVVQEDLINLTLEKVINRALTDNSNLQILSYQLDILDRQKHGAENNLDDIEDVLDDLKGSGIPGIKGSYYDARDQLLDQLEQLELQKPMSEIQIASTKEGVQTLVTSRYVQLLALQDQIELSKQLLQWLEEDLKVLKLKNEVGLVSKTEVRNLEREMESLASKIDDTQSTYDDELLKLLVDLNIPYSENITLADIENIEVAQVVKPAEIKTLIDNSYTMKTTTKNVEVAELNLKQNWYSGTAGRQTYQIQVDIAKEQVTQSEKELTNSINSLYDQADTIYESYQDAQRELSYLEEDQNRLRIQYEVGLISKVDYEKINRSVAQKEAQLEQLKYNYFMTQKQIEAAQRGYIS
ncbi:TolC family protein [Ureibacillus composti]